MWHTQCRTSRSSSAASFLSSGLPRPWGAARHRRAPRSPHGLPARRARCGAWRRSVRLSRSRRGPRRRSGASNVLIGCRGVGGEAVADPPVVITGQRLEHSWWCVGVERGRGAHLPAVVRSQHLQHLVSGSARCVPPPVAPRSWDRSASTANASAPIGRCGHLGTHPFGPVTHTRGDRPAAVCAALAAAAARTCSEPVCQQRLEHLSVAWRGWLRRFGAPTRRDLPPGSPAPGSVPPRRVPPPQRTREDSSPHRRRSVDTGSVGVPRGHIAHLPVTNCLASTPNSDGLALWFWAARNSGCPAPIVGCARRNSIRAGVVGFDDDQVCDLYIAIVVLDDPFEHRARHRGVRRRGHGRQPRSRGGRRSRSQNTGGISDIQ